MIRYGYSGRAAHPFELRVPPRWPPGRTLRLVTFVNEEPPFFYGEEMGSRVYANRSRERGEQIRGMLALETMGYYSSKPNSQAYPPLFKYFYPSIGNFISLFLPSSFGGDIYRIYALKNYNSDYLQSTSSVHPASGAYSGIVLP